MTSKKNPKYTVTEAQHSDVGKSIAREAGMNAIRHAQQNDGTQITILQDDLENAYEVVRLNRETSAN